MTAINTAARNHTLDEILHGMFALAISAAAIFVKNPNSQQHAASIINLATNTVLPLADVLLNPPQQDQPVAVVVGAAPAGLPVGSTAPAK